MNAYQNNTHKVNNPKTTVLNNLKTCAQQQNWTNALDIIKKSTGIPPNIPPDIPLIFTLANIQQISTFNHQEVR